MDPFLSQQQNPGPDPVKTGRLGVPTSAALSAFCNGLSALTAPPTRLSPEASQAILRGMEAVQATANSPSQAGDGDWTFQMERSGPASWILSFKRPLPAAEVRFHVDTEYQPHGVFSVLCSGREGLFDFAAVESGWELCQWHGLHSVRFPLDLAAGTVLPWSATPKLDPSEAPVATGNAPVAMDRILDVPGSTPSEGAARWSLVVVGGADSGREYVLQPLMRVGRETECEICPAQLDISRRHASIQVAGDECEIRDLGSSFGTKVNGTRLGSAPQRIYDGDVVEFSTYRCMVRGVPRPSIHDAFTRALPALSAAPPAPLPPTPSVPLPAPVAEQPLPPIPQPDLFPPVSPVPPPPPPLPPEAVPQPPIVIPPPPPRAMRETADSPLVPPLPAGPPLVAEQCPQCHATYVPSDKFCMRCGTPRVPASAPPPVVSAPPPPPLPLPGATVSVAEECPKCHAPYVPSDKFCMRCGTPRLPASAPPPVVSAPPPPSPPPALPPLPGATVSVAEECPKCHAPYVPSDKFCMRCGTPRLPASAPPPVVSAPPPPPLPLPPLPGATAPVAEQCPKCHAPYVPNDKFCMRCGTPRLPASAPPPVVSAPPPALPPLPPLPGATAPVAEQCPKCHGPYVPSDKFCMRCGTPRVPAQAPPPVAAPPPPPPVAESRCSHCGFVIKPNDRFCQGCGKPSAPPAPQPPPPQAGIRCPRCSTPFEPGWRFCGKCGAPAGPQ